MSTYTIGSPSVPGIPFSVVRRGLAWDLWHTDPINVGEWHAVDVSASEAHHTYELQDVMVRYEIPSTMDDLLTDIQPSEPWAEDHFQERVSGDPMNPPPSSAWWPYGNTKRHTQTQPGETVARFSHTYPERFWPRWDVNAVTVKPGADMDPSWWSADGPGFAEGWDSARVVEAGLGTHPERRGIRYRYGDLSDVVNLLVAKPLTRQAYLPVWFPEDTGAHHGERVPCTLGYHFMIRDGRLSCRYFIRSVDFIRHFQDDVYMACRLVQWVCDAVNARWNTEGVPEGHPMEWDLLPGNLTMFISSLHAMRFDRTRLMEIGDGD